MGRGSKRAGALLVALTALQLLPGAAAAKPKATDLLKTTAVTIHSPTFHRPADASAMRRCLELAEDLKTLVGPDYRKCRAASYALGERLPLGLVTVEVRSNDRGLIDEEVREMALLAASQVAGTEGHRFLTKTDQLEYSRCSGTPTATTTATISGNTIFGSTMWGQSARCGILYEATFLLFDRYEDIQGGVLVPTETGGGTLQADLYFDISDSVAATRSGDDQRQFGFVRSHPLEPWRRYLPAQASFAALIKKYGLREPIKVAVRAPPRPAQKAQSLEDTLAIRGGLAPGAQAR